MAGMVDIHCHVLPGVDDGAADIESALQMLTRGRAEGIRVAVLTPHINAADSEERDAFHRQRFEELAAAAAGVDVEIHLGAELAFRYGLAAVAAWPSGALAGGRYVLVDLPPGPLSPGTGARVLRAPHSRVQADTRAPGAPPGTGEISDLHRASARARSVVSDRWRKSARPLRQARPRRRRDDAASRVGGIRG